LQFVKAGGKCDPVDSQIFTFLLSFLRHHRLSTDIRLGGGWLRDRVGQPHAMRAALHLTHVVWLYQLMFPNARLKSHGMDFVLSDMQVCDAWPQREGFLFFKTD
jgi:hypothetical protein